MGPLSDEESRPHDVLAMIYCAQRLIDAKNRVLCTLTEDRREHEDIREAILVMQKKQDKIVAALGQIQQSSSPSRSPEGRSKHVNREVSVRPHITCMLGIKCVSLCDFKSFSFKYKESIRI